MAATRRKATDKQAADILAAYQRGEELPAGTIIDFTEAPFVFHATGKESPPDTAPVADPATGTEKSGGK